MKFEVNQPLKPLEKPPLSREQLKSYAEASGDNNPIHLDDNFAKNAGFPSVIAHGMLSMAFLGDCIDFNFPRTQFALKKFSCRFKKVTFPGDVITSKGKIKSVSPNGSLSVLLWAENQSGEHTCEGEALIEPLI
ncbi:MAG: MaoC/PaaZ C-terminal domain-containing protein [Deltaproteobacteria bacterium]